MARLPLWSQFLAGLGMEWALSGPVPVPHSPVGPSWVTSLMMRLSSASRPPLKQLSPLQSGVLFLGPPQWGTAWWRKQQKPAIAQSGGQEFGIGVHGVSSCYRREGASVPCAPLGSWWLIGNSWHSLHHRHTSPVTAFLFARWSPCVRFLAQMFPLFTRTKLLPQ